MFSDITQSLHNSVAVADYGTWGCSQIT